MQNYSSVTASPMPFCCVSQVVGVCVGVYHCESAWIFYFYSPYRLIFNVSISSSCRLNRQAVLLPHKYWYRLFYQHKKKARLLLEPKILQLPHLPHPTPPQSHPLFLPEHYQECFLFKPFFVYLHGWVFDKWTTWGNCVQAARDNWLSAFVENKNF